LLPEFYVVSILELSEIFADLLPKMSGGQFKTASRNVTRLAEKAKKQNRNPYWEILTYCVYLSTCGSDKTVAEREAWNNNYMFYQRQYKFLT
jgi:hypothetical protein